MSARDDRAIELANWIADAEWQLELDRRLADSYLSRQAREAAEWGEIGGMSAQAWVDLVESVRCPAVAGLVPVLTTGNRARKKPVVPFRVRSDAQAVQRAVSAFVPDQGQRRLSGLRMQTGVAARLHNAATAGARVEALMVTLTYRDGADWQGGQVKELLRYMRLWHQRRGLAFRYVWVAELQDGKRRADRQGRGAIHYHIVLWVPAGTRLPMPDKQGWWPHGSTRIEVARGAVQYLMSYLKKGDKGAYERLPKGARAYGVGGLDHVARRTRRWLRLPGFVQGNSSVLDDWRRAPKGGGWIAPDGRRWQSEFRRAYCGDAWGLERVASHPRAVDAAGPFSWWEPARAIGGAGPFSWLKELQ